MAVATASNGGTILVGAQTGTITRFDIPSNIGANAIKPDKNLSVDRPASSALYRALQVIQRYRRN